MHLRTNAILPTIKGKSRPKCQLGECDHYPLRDNAAEAKKALGFDFQFTFNTYVTVQIVCLTSKSLTLNRRRFYARFMLYIICMLSKKRGERDGKREMLILRNNGVGQFVTFSARLALTNGLWSNWVEIFPRFHHRQILMLLANYSNIAHTMTQKTM